MAIIVIGSNEQFKKADISHFHDYKILGVQSSFAELSISDDQSYSYFFYSNVIELIADNLREGKTVADTSNSCLALIKDTIRFFKQNRRGCSLISLSALQAFDEEERQEIIAKLNLDQVKGLKVFLEDSCSCVDVYTLAALQVIKDNKPLIKALLELEACSFLSSTNQSINIQAILQEVNQLKDQFKEIEFSLDNAQKIEQKLKTDLNAALTENQTQTKQYEQLAQEAKQSNEENELLIQQLHQVQEELESSFNKVEQLTQAKTDLEVTIANEVVQLTEENELLIQQLHYVQEELETLFNDKERTQQAHLITQTNIISSEMLDLQATLVWIKALCRKEVKEHYKQSRRFRTSVKKLVKLLNQSGFFDSQWYVDNYPDIKGSSMEPAMHYLLYGAFEGRNPSAGFNTLNYIYSYPDIAESGMNPLVHYLKFGQFESREADPRRRCLPAPNRK